MTDILSVLVDRTNWLEHRDALVAMLRASKFIGIDLETQDDDRHEGLNRFCGYDPITRKKSTRSKLVFDMKRIVVCGLSLCAGSTAYYLNLNHADVDNRLDWVGVAAVLDAKPKDHWWVAHNAAFEICVLRSAYNYALDPMIIDTLQMCVSAYGPHEYRIDDWVGIGQGAMQPIIEQILPESIEGLLDPKAMTMTPTLNELVYKIIGKTSDAAYSYNGIVNTISYGYGLKKAVKSHFGVDMTTFAECLGDKAHMGQLTGAEVCSYGAEDAYWAVKLFFHLATMMSPELLKTFFEQENPMAAVYAEIQQNGLRVDLGAIDKKRDEEREKTAVVLRKMKAAISKLLPFKAEPFEPLMSEKWYAKNYATYRQQISLWAEMPDEESAYGEVRLVRGAVSNAWGDDEGEESRSFGPNLSHYMPVRTIIYDLFQQKPIKDKGKIQSNGETRTKIRARVTDQNMIDVCDGLAALANIEQAMKLYLTPYVQLTDPETQHLHPVMTSTLATRRMSCSTPNGQQLAKRGESTYVRGFFKADYDDHVIVSADFSAVELVAIGEASGDPEFIKAFGQIPHQDLHSGAAAAVLSVELPDLTEDAFKALKKCSAEDAKNLPARLVTDLQGRPLPHDKIYGYWRTEIGKGANFEFWFSNWLANVARKMGWDQDTTGKAVEKYTDLYRVAADWRSNLVSEVQTNGFIELPDHHRYVRCEATTEWLYQWMAKFPVNREHQELLANYLHIIRWMGGKIQKRALNQTVNARIQGFCASLAKRSCLRIGQAIEKNKWTPREARPMLLVHDELIFSVHRDLVPEFVPMMRNQMITHPDWFRLCELDAAPSIGFTFEPWNEKKARLGQLELFELPQSEFGQELASRRVLDASGIKQAVDWLFEERERLH